jgi:hypothetical protein
MPLNSLEYPTFWEKNNVYMYTHILVDLNSNSSVSIQPSNRSGCVTIPPGRSTLPPMPHQATTACRHPQPSHHETRFGQSVDGSTQRPATSDQSPVGAWAVVGGSPHVLRARGRPPVVLVGRPPTIGEGARPRQAACRRLDLEPWTAGPRTSTPLQQIGEHRAPPLNIQSMSILSY